jgi:hypothetical protein
VLITVSVTVNVASTRIEEIESEAIRASRQAARRAIEEACERIEASRRRRRRVGTRRRVVLTKAGWITIRRGRTRRADGTYYFPLDERLELPAHHEATPAVRRRGTQLAAIHPYREAARLLSAEIDERVDHRALWRWVQADGDAVLRARAEGIKAMFDDGEAPPRPTEAIPDALTVAVDATGIRVVGGGRVGVKLAVAYTGTSGPKSRRRLLRRHLFAEIAEVDEFGRALAHELERTYGAHRIGRLMLLADGEPWIKGLATDWLPTARYQCDHWHLAAKVRAFCGVDERRFRRMLDRAFATPDQLARDLVRGRYRGDPEQALKLATYLSTNGASLDTYRRMGPGRWHHGSGPAEKHIELTVNRRFKRRGMRWSVAGARNLLALRLEVIAS